MPAVEKDTEKWAAGKILGPSYFEATLVTVFSRTIFFLLLHKIQTPRHKHAKWLPSDLTPWTLTLTKLHDFLSFSPTWFSDLYSYLSNKRTCRMPVDFHVMD